MVHLGQTARDVITQFEGLVMARSEYLTGCTQILLVPRGLDKDGKRQEGEWFDEPRLEITKSEVLDFGQVVLTPSSKPGRDESEAPKR